LDVSSEQRSTSDLPAVDERLIMPNTRYEVLDGKVVYVSPSDQPHGSRHSKLQALLEAYAADGYDAACDMLTRTSAENDMAPDGSIYPAAPDPDTGGRRLEELAFEVISTERLSHAGRKAAALVGRGVRRVFAIDVERGRGLEWSSTTSTWEILAPDAVIEDHALVLPLRIHDLVAAGNADDAVARALIAKGNPVLTAALDARQAEGEARGKAMAVLAVLSSRGVPISEDERSAILATREPSLLDAMLRDVSHCETTRDLLAPADRG
jgi:hypothetical protein